MGQLAARGMLDKVPAAPELRMGLGLFLEAFWDLNTCRPAGMDLGPISWLSINAYADARGLDDEQRDDLQFFVHAMDRAFLEHRGKQAEKERKRGQRGHKNNADSVQSKHPRKGSRGRASSG